MTKPWQFLLILLSASPAAGQAPAHAPLQRQYQAGQSVAYRMTGDNDGWHYAIEARGAVVSEPGGAFHEDFAWSNLMSDGHVQALPPAMAAWRQRLSLDPSQMPLPADLSQADARMIGPITDLMTFYVDLWLANKLGQLRKPGDHFYFPNPMTPSWADGSRVRLGEDAVDFDMALKSLDASGTATLEVRHVPPPQPRIHLPAPWMQAAAGTPHNWVEVRALGDGTFSAAVGEESFDVTVTIALSDGHIVHGEMTNPVKAVVRICTDQALTQCSEPRPNQILRKVAIDEIR